MNIETKYFFYEEDTNNLLHLNDCYAFIWEYFDSETDAYEALIRLGSMLEKSFGKHPVYVKLELKKCIIYTNQLG